MSGVIAIVYVAYEWFMYLPECSTRLCIFSIYLSLPSAVIWIFVWRAMLEWCLKKVLSRLTGER